jgi:anthranilate phosphoribosyltransferase
MRPHAPPESATVPGNEPALPYDGNLKPLIARVATGATLSEQEAQDAFSIIMSGAATPAQIAGLIMAMRVRGEVVAEMVGAVRAVRAHMVSIDAPEGAIDVCGTGGDHAGTLNVSTAVTFVVAGLGVPVAKHGNRALSSRTGGADVLQALGVETDVPVESLAAILRAASATFLFAPRHHAAWRHAAGVRVELGTRTIFNLLGPMANPANVRRQLAGVFDPKWLAPMAETLGRLGASHVWLVHGMGLDELTVAGESLVAEYRDGTLRQFAVTPEDAGLPRSPLAAIQGGDAPENAAALLALLGGARSAYRDTVLLNAAAALIVAGRARDLREGAALAAGSIESGAAMAALEALRRETNAHRAPAR